MVPPPPTPSPNSILAANWRAKKIGTEMARVDTVRRESPGPLDPMGHQTARPRRHAQAARPRLRVCQQAAPVLPLLKPVLELKALHVELAASRKKFRETAQAPSLRLESRSPLRRRQQTLPQPDSPAGLHQPHPKAS